MKSDRLGFPLWVAPQPHMPHHGMLLRPPDLTNAHLRSSSYPFTVAAAGGGGLAAASDGGVSGFLKLSALVDDATVFMCDCSPASSNSLPAVIASGRYSWATATQHNEA